MGVVGGSIIGNIKKNIRDIGGGIVSVIKGDPKTDREREIIRNEREFEERRSNPIQDTSGYTSSRYGGGSSGGSSGGRTGGGISYDQKSATATEAAQKAAEEKAKIEAQKAAAERQAKLQAELAAKRQAADIALQYQPNMQTYQQIQKQRQLSMQPSVQPYKATTWERIKDLPSKGIEKITGKKPREVFRQLVGSKETDVTKPITRKELVVETTTAPAKAIQIVGAASGLGAEKLAEKTIISEEPYIKIKERKTNIYEPQFGTKTSESESGFIKKEITIPEKVYSITPEKVGKVTSGTVQLGGFLAAPMLFAPGMMIKGISKLTDKSLTTKERVYGGVEATFGATIIGGKFVGAIRSTTPSRYIRNPKTKIVDIEQQFVKETEVAKRFGVETKVTEQAEQRFSLFKKQKGKTTTVQDKPTDVWLGTVKEERKLGIFKKTKEFTGEVKIAKGEYLETINYGDNIKKVTKIKPSGAGDIKVYEGTELIETAKIPKGKAPEIKLRTIKPEPKVSEVKFGTDRTVERTTVKDFLQKDNVFKLSQTPTKTPITGISKLEISREVKYGKDVTTGISRTLETQKKRLDAIKASPQRTVESAKTEFATIKKVKETGSRIEYGEGDKLVPKDWTKYTETDGLKQLKTKISPKTDRYIQEKSTARSLTIFEAPPTKLNKLTTRAEKTKIKQAKQIEETMARLTPSEEVGGQKLKLVTKATNKDTVYIAKPETFLKKIESTTPTINIAPTVEKEVSRGISTTPMFPRVSAANTQPTIEIEEVSPSFGRVRMDMVRETTKPEIGSAVQIDTKSDIKPKQESITILKPITRTTSGTRQKEETATIQMQKPVEITKTIQIQEPITKLREVTKTIKQQRISEPKIRKINIPFKPNDSLAKRILEKVEEQPNIFEGFIFKSGKEVSIGKGSKEKITQKLSKSLKGSLSASGYLSLGGKKVKASETGLLKDVEFRTGKKKDYLIVEKKSKRLRKGTTGKEVQFFRKKSKGKNSIL